jgi:3-(3-hydroxy-phenyl)propionate hydroxylase
MLKTYTYPEFAYRPSPEQSVGQTVSHPVVIVGAGPVGLTLALDCASRGLRTVVLDDNNTVSIGSRAVCYAKRTLEIWDRLGIGQSLAERGIQWQVGKVFFGQTQAYQFNLLPEAHHKMPAMINLQQYYLEETLVRACENNPADRPALEAQTHCP